MFSSCRRNKNCDLIVTVTDGNTSGPVVGATVHIYPNQTNTSGNLKIQDQTSTTDASCVAIFTFTIPDIVSADVNSHAPLNPLINKLDNLDVSRGLYSTNVYPRYKWSHPF